MIFIGNTISIQELRENLPTIIKQVEAGNTFTLIYRSRPIGQLTPLLPHQKKPRCSLLEALASPSQDLLFRSKTGVTTLIRDDR